MFTEDELSRLRAQISRRRIMISLPAVLLAGAAVAMIVIRMGLRADAVKALHDAQTKGAISACEILAAVFATLAAFWLIFAHGMLFSPLKKYEKHLDGVLHGPRHEIEGDWSGVSGDLSEVDGVTCRAVGLTVPDGHGRHYERLFYWDKQKPLPEIEQGARVRILYHGKQVVSLTPVAEAAE